MTMMAALDNLLSGSSSVVPVERDNANLDVYRTYQDPVTRGRTDLDDADGWIHLVNLCDKHRGSTVVLNAAARSNVAVSRHGETRRQHHQSARC